MISDHVFPELCSTSFGEHISEEEEYEETSWEPLGKRLCGKSLDPRLAKLSDCAPPAAAETLRRTFGEG